MDTIAILTGRYTLTPSGKGNDSCQEAQLTRAIHNRRCDYVPMYVIVHLVGWHPLNIFLEIIKKAQIIIPVKDTKESFLK